MKDFVLKLESDLDSKLHFIHLENEEMIKLAELSLQESRNAIQKLKNFTMKYKFKSETEEIDFFKHQKSRFLSRMIYYNEMYITEAQKPKGGEEVLKRYYHNALNHIKRFFDKNVEFYKYYRTQSTYLDNKYFTRKNLDIKLILDTFVFEADSRFRTSHDYKAAKIMANDMLEVYLKNELIKLDHTNPDSSFLMNTPKVKLTWTDHKSALIELIYALYYYGSFNNGTTDIIEISRYFETIFNIDLGDVYRTFLELKNRNIRTKFISNLNDILQKKMQESDLWKIPNLGIFPNTNIFVKNLIRIVVRFFLFFWKNVLIFLLFKSNCQKNNTQLGSALWILFCRISKICQNKTN